MTTAKKHIVMKKYQCTSCWEYYAEHEGKSLVCPYCGSLEAEEVKNGIEIKNKM